MSRNIINAITRGMRNEVRNIKTFVSRPVGPFETIDAVVKDARRMVREVGGSVGIKKMFNQFNPLGKRGRRPKLLRR